MHHIGQVNHHTVNDLSPDGRSMLFQSMTRTHDQTCPLDERPQKFQIKIFTAPHNNTNSTTSFPKRHFQHNNCKVHKVNDLSLELLLFLVQLF